MMTTLQQQESTAQATRTTGGSQSAKSHPSRTIVHAKLEMTEPGDHDEQEADAVANMVVSGGKIARKISNGGSGSSGIAVSPQMESQLSQLQGGGRQMPEGLRNMMESGFGQDFSQVRLHTDSEAASMSSSINARAFTLGNDIYFNRGQFSPETTEGQRLVAHELTHVVQGGGKVGRDLIGWVDDAIESVKEFGNKYLPIETFSASLIYLSGDGHPMSYGDVTKDSIKNSCNMRYYRKRLVSGETEKLAEGSGLPIDLTFFICRGEKTEGMTQNPQFYVGRTTMSYKTTCNKEKRECTTTFTVPSKDGDDGFWDVNEFAEFIGNQFDIERYKTDGSGDKLEVLGIPYKFMQFSWKETFPLPSNYDVDEYGNPYKTNSTQISTKPIIYKKPEEDNTQSHANIPDYLESENTLIDHLISIAREEAGYLEKKSDKQLYDKEKNKGNNNYVKYSKDLDQKNGVAWCDWFVHWCFVKAFNPFDFNIRKNKDNNFYEIKKNILSYTMYETNKMNGSVSESMKDYGNNAFINESFDRKKIDTKFNVTQEQIESSNAELTEEQKNWKSYQRRYDQIINTKGTPQKGDVIFFVGHIGLVIEVADGKVTTIEGNTNGGPGVESNGNGVYIKSYSLTNDNIMGYGRPNYTGLLEYLKKEYENNKFLNGSTKT